MAKKSFFQVFDADHSGELDFAEFVKVPKEKISSCFLTIAKGPGNVHNEERGEGEKAEILI